VGPRAQVVWCNFSRPSHGKGHVLWCTTQIPPCHDIGRGDGFRVPSLLSVCFLLFASPTWHNSISVSLHPYLADGGAGSRENVVRKFVCLFPWFDLGSWRIRTEGRRRRQGARASFPRLTMLRVLADCMPIMPHITAAGERFLVREQVLFRQLQ